MRVEATLVAAGHDRVLRVAVLANLGREPIEARVDLSAFVGTEPCDLLTERQLPAIGDAPYLVGLDSHGGLWLELGASPRDSNP